MKKFLSILLAVVLCLSLSVCAFAEEEPVVSDETLQDLIDGIGDLVDAESEDNDAALKEAIEALSDSLSAVEGTSDMQALVEQLKKYAESADVDAGSVFSDLGALQDVFDKFLGDSGADLDKIKTDLESSSALNTLVGLYTGAYTNVPTTEETPVDEPDVPNPPTGDSATGVVVALSVLAVSAAAVVVCTKKKED